MDTVLTMITWLIGKAAESGAGFFSWGAGYQPEIPEEMCIRDSYVLGLAKQETDHILYRISLDLSLIHIWIK